MSSSYFGIQASACPKGVSHHVNPENFTIRLMRINGPRGVSVNTSKSLGFCLMNASLRSASSYFSISGYSFFAAAHASGRSNQPTPYLSSRLRLLAIARMASSSSGDKFSFGSLSSSDDSIHLRCICVEDGDVEWVMGCCDDTTLLGRRRVDMLKRLLTLNASASGKNDVKNNNESNGIDFMVDGMIG